MRWIIGASLKFRYLVVAASVALLVVGISTLRDTPVDVFPEFSQPKIEVQTITIGLSAEETEELVTVPIEQALIGLPNLDTIRSKSVPQLSDVVMLFDRGTDLLRARQLVQERVTAITPTLPTWAAPPVMLQPLSSTSRVMKIGFTSDTVSLIDMSNIAYWKIRTRLLRVPGVANAPIWGERLKQMQVQIDPEKLRRHQVSLVTIMDSTAEALDAGILRYSEAFNIGSGGFIDTPNQRLNVRHVLPIATPTDLTKVPIYKRNGERIPLSAVADLTWEHQPMIGDAVINDGPGLMIIVEKLPWANNLEVTRGVEQAIEELKPGLPGIEIDTTIFRPASFIELSLDNLTRALLIGALLVILVIGAFLFEWRAALISVVSIPLSLVGAGLVLYFRETTVNVMVLAGLVIALGVVVDDAIIDVENIVRRLRQHRAEGDTRSSATIVLEASLEVRGSIVYATLIIFAAMMPVFFLTGLTGAFFKPLAFSYVLAVAVSLVIALTVTPALALIMLGNRPLERRQPPLVRWLQGGYGRLLSKIVSRPQWAYVVAGVTAVAGIVVYPLLGQSLLPNFKERDFLMHWLTNPDTSGPEEYRVSVAACKELRTIPGVRNCGSHIGNAFLGDEPYGVYFGENWISIDPKVDYDKTYAAVSEVVAGYPGIQRDVQTYLRERVKEVLTGASDAVVVRIYGDDLHVLEEKADEVLEMMQGVDGALDPKKELHVFIPQVNVRVDLAKAQRYGVKPGDVRRSSATWMASEEVGDVFVAGKAYDVHVWSKPRARDSLTDIQGLPIDTPTGSIRLDQVASVKIEESPSSISRVNATRKIDVTTNVEGRDLGSVANEIEERLEDIHMPIGFNAEVLGENKERKSSQGRLFLFGGAAAILIFLLLQASFGSWRLATLSFLTLPMALVGGALAAYFTDGILSLGSLVGFYTVFGIAARNGILMINHFQHLERYEGEAFGPGLVLRGAKERLSPILMTTLAAGLALVPLVVAGRIPGHEVEHPMAIVILGGLVTSTLLNLFVVPSLYLRFGKKGWSRSAAPQAA
ncbi:MAG TPA: efflux RND transporter permease subunit [Gaiellaceae bacterium]|nr:efflux RND transporter permease subunit [Gaiellaceae bacterium]